MEHVFISYVREDSAKVDRLAQQLRSHGISVWLDRESIAPGSRWRDAIREAIESGAYFLACFSRESNLKEATYQNEELVTAIEQLRLRSHHVSWFLPVRLDDCQVPDRSIGAGETLRSLQYVDLWGDWRIGIRRLLSVIRPGSSIGNEIRPEYSTSKADRPSVKTGDLFALDFGTSFSTVAVLGEENQTVFVPAPNGRTLVPSVLVFESNLDYSIGWEALESANLNPDRAFFNLKRFLGTDRQFIVGQHEYGAELLASLIIASLKKNVEEYLGKTLTGALVAVPANFSIGQANALARACELAGITVRRLIGEPNAAGLLYSEIIELDEIKLRNVLVLDLGGGTFDVSVLELGAGIVEAKAIVGTNRLGGSDYDEALYDFAASRFAEDLGRLGCEPELSGLDRLRLRTETQRAKIALSSRSETSIILSGVERQGHGMINLDLRVSRADARDLMKPLDHKAEECIVRALDIADLKVVQLHSVMLAGQGMRLFTLQELVERLFLTVPLVQRFQEAAVARGLCHYLGVLSGDNPNLLLLDSNYTSIALRCGEIFGRKEGPDCKIHSKSPLNKNLLEILSLATTIPMLKKFEVVVGESGLIQVEVVELGADPHRTVSEVTSVLLSELKQDQHFEIVIDTDANRTIMLWVSDPSSETIQGIQLNNPFAKHIGVGPKGNFGMDKEVENFAILPIFKVAK